MPKTNMLLNKTTKTTTLAKKTRAGAAAGAAVKEGARRSTRFVGNTKDRNDFDDAVFAAAEERLMRDEDDEEITSVEDEEEVVLEEDNESVDGALLKAALAESVANQQGPNVEHGGTAVDSSSADADADARRYGLRKRPRPAGQDLERLERWQASNEGGLARVAMASSGAKRDLDAAASSSKARPTRQTLSTTRFTSLTPTRSNASRKVVSVAPAAAAASLVNPLYGRPRTRTEESLSLMPMADLDTERTRKISFQESDNRMRGFSIDMDVSIGGLDLPDDSSAAAPALAGVGAASEGGRPRAFSFECFAFGINADEPLPELEQATSGNATGGTRGAGGRPRGDSIIFDPSSFRDGGILEQNALERRSNNDMSATAPMASSAATRPPPDKKSAATVAATQSSFPPVGRRTAVAVPAMPPPLSAMAYGSALAAPPTAAGAVSLDLVNKDGRVGIYLPEARRARIARFHAKRHKRVWRKRIKYDCRKKLADSRPRVKGRFVKRADDEE